MWIPTAPVTCAVTLQTTNRHPYCLLYPLRTMILRTPENPSDKKKKKKEKSRRQERRRSKGAKAIATSKIMVNLPEFTGKDLGEFAESFCRFLGMTGQTHDSSPMKCDLLLQC